MEIFATALLLETDIWVFLGQRGTRWVGFSGYGYNLDRFLKEPTSNGIYIRNLGCHYEPILCLEQRLDIPPSDSKSSRISSIFFKDILYFDLAQNTRKY